jgi:hypothetical protein
LYQETIGHCEAKHSKLWFDEECLHLVDKRKQVKLQRLQDPSVVNEHHLCNVRREASRHFKKKKREHLKDKINALESSSKNKNIRHLYRGINEFKKDYQSTTNLVKDENADPHKILIRWMNYFRQLLNVQRVGVLGRQKYRQQSHLCQSPPSLSLKFLLES